MMFTWLAILCRCIDESVSGGGGDDGNSLSGGGCGGSDDDSLSGGSLSGSG